jgi:hypothetical protein
VTHREIPRFSRGYVTIHVTKLRGVASRFTALFYVGSFAFPFDLSSQAEDKTTEIRTGLMTGFVPTFHRAGAQNCAQSVGDPALLLVRWPDFEPWLPPRGCPYADGILPRRAPGRSPLSLHILSLPVRQ